LKVRARRRAPVNCRFKLWIHFHNFGWQPKLFARIVIGICNTDLNLSGLEKAEHLVQLVIYGNPRLSPIYWTTKPLV
jgi:hypothetical protein